MVERIKAFIRGAASAFDLMPNDQNKHKSETQYMSEAWEEVGRDLRKACSHFDRELIKRD